MYASVELSRSVHSTPFHPYQRLTPQTSTYGTYGTYSLCRSFVRSLCPSTVDRPSAAARLAVLLAGSGWQCFDLRPEDRPVPSRPVRTVRTVHLHSRIQGKVGQVRIGIPRNLLTYKRAQGFRTEPRRNSKHERSLRSRLDRSTKLPRSHSHSTA